jgi:polyhydroxyalkanoate synthase
MMNKPESSEFSTSDATVHIAPVIDPAIAAELQGRYAKEFSTLWQQMLTAQVPAVADRRFANPAWQSSSLHAFNAAAYLLNGKYLAAMADAMQVPPKDKQKIRFAVEQMVNAMSPANFLFSNPEAQQKIIETNGESLTAGLKHLFEDIQKGRISQSDESAFEVGRNVAITEGAVVFENELFQLLQYTPLTATVYERPLLLVPPCINKYYILDLQPHNSFVRYAVEQGHTVFLISWRNADASIAGATWDDYIESGVLKAIAVVQSVSDQEKINVLGFCVGGTMLTNALALACVRGEKPIASLTLLTTFIDFSDTGLLDVYIDEEKVKETEQAIGQGGLMKGLDFNAAFASLRSNELIWSYVTSHYLKGENPAPFDMLYWNADSTNLPGPMYCWYLRNTYLENNLKQFGKFKLAGKKIDFGKIDAPSFIYGSRDDHIVPWTSAYASTNILNRKKPQQNHFVLGASGHIAGVINPPGKNKRHYWINDTPATKNDADALTWLTDATEVAGSWWPAWADFLVQHAGKKIKARPRLGNAEFKVIEAAPGRYVKVKAS